MARDTKQLIDIFFARHTLVFIAVAAFYCAYVATLWAGYERRVLAGLKKVTI